MAFCPSCGEENPDKAKFCLECATPLQIGTAPPQEARKTVSILFCDLVGSTALGERLDPESVREVMDRYFTEMRTVVLSHGGIVEKYIGDAIMAVFGLPRAHEDDAMRAVRAAWDMRGILRTLNSELEEHWGVTLANRTGINTGEVVVGDPVSGQRLVTGDAVNVAARLEQAAGRDEVLIGELTLRLVRDAIGFSPVAPLALKGKAQPMPAYRVTEVRSAAEGIARRLDTALVGRDREVAAMCGAFDAAITEGACRLLTVLGEAGVGKSRLVGEVVARLRPRATALTGRCLSYGEGITFWPLAEVARQAALIVDDDSPDAARDKLGRALNEDDDGAVADRIASVVGVASTSFPIEEIFWAGRRLLESRARETPLVVVFEDVHWADATFLDWIDHVLTHAHAPILFVCSARPELTEARPALGRAGGRAELIELSPLSAGESEVMIRKLLGDSPSAAEVGFRINAAAQGNPLFVEQVVSMWIDDGTLRKEDGEWSLAGDVSSVPIPPTLAGLLTARLDRLPPDERTVLVGSSVIGQVFYRGAVEELTPPALLCDVPRSLSALVTKQFIRPDSSTFTGEEAFAFRHGLVREAAYEGMLKRTRAELHERFAHWLEQAAKERIGEYEEIIGYHFEQAFRYRAEIGVVDDEGRRVGATAARFLSAGGQRALGLGNTGAAVNLLSRAEALIDHEPHLHAELLVALGAALNSCGDHPSARARLEQAAATARAIGDVRLEGLAFVEAVNCDFDAGETDLEAVREELQGWIGRFEKMGDEEGSARAKAVMAAFYWAQFRLADAQRMIEEARTQGRGRGLGRVDGAYAWIVSFALAQGPTPVHVGLRRCHELLDELAGNPRAEASVKWLAFPLLCAMRGNFGEARRWIAEGHAMWSDLGWGHNDLARTSGGYVELLAGDPEAAERELEWSRRALTSVGEKAILASILGLLAITKCDLGKFDEAIALAHECADVAAADDIEAQALWRRARARALAVKGLHPEAERLLQEVVAVSRSTDSPALLADALMDLAEVLDRARRRKEALDAVREALTLYEAKGNVVSAARARDALSRG